MVALFVLTGFTEVAAQEKKFEIVMIAKTEGLAWFDAMKVGVKEFNDTHPDVNAYQHSPEGADAVKQVAMIEDYIAKGVDAICIVPNDPKALIPVVKKAKEAGIIVVIHEGAALCGIADFDLEVIDNVALGALMGKALGEAMGGKGKYASTVGGLTMQTHMDWWTGGTNYIKANFPDIKLLNAQPYEDHDDAQVGYEICKQILQTTPDITGFIGYTVESHSSMCRLIKETNNKNVKVSGLAVPSALREYIKEGWTVGAFGNSPVDAGYATVNIAYMLLKGEKIKDGDVINLGKPGLEACTVKNGLIQGHAELEFTPENVDQYNF
jgi:simple sugar transport system substrate-binding protein